MGVYGRQIDRPRDERDRGRQGDRLTLTHTDRKVNKDIDRQWKREVNKQTDISRQTNTKIHRKK